MTWLGRIAVVEALAIAGVSAWLLLRPREGIAVLGPASRAVADTPATSGDARREAQTGGAVAPAAPVSAAAPAPVADPVGLMLFGRVTDPAGKPLDGGWLQATPRGEGPHRSGEVAASGEYALVGLSSGEWDLSCKKDGFRQLTRTVTLPPAPAEQRLDLVLQPAVQLGVWFVTPDGKRLQNAMHEAQLWTLELTAFATQSPPSGHLMPSRRGGLWGRGLGNWRGIDPTQRGKVSNPETPDGTFQLDEDLPVCLSAVLQHCVLATQRVEPGQTQVRFTLGLDSVRGVLAALKLRATDAQTGAPLAGAGITVSSRFGMKTGADGGFEMKDLTPGPTQITVSAKDHEMLRFSFHLQPGQTTDLGTLALGKALKLTGTVIGPDDKPVAATITWLDLDRARFTHAVESNHIAQADGDGRFEVWQPGPTRYMVVASAEGLAPAAALADLRNGACPELRLQLQRGTRVTLDKRLDMEDEFEVLVKDHEGRIPWSGQLVQRHATTFLLAPGAYTLELHGQDGLRRAVPFAVGSAPVTVPVER